MSDAPFTTFDIIAVAAVIGSLVTVVGVLWRAFKQQVADLKADRDKLAAQLAEVVRRVRTLEDNRVVEVKDYAVKVEANNARWEASNTRMANVFTRVINTLQDLVKQIAVMNGRTCQVGHPLEGVQVDTEVILKAGERAKRAADAENDKP